MFERDFCFYKVYSEWAGRSEQSITSLSRSEQSELLTRFYTLSNNV